MSIELVTLPHGNSTILYSLFIIFINFIVDMVRIELTLTIMSVLVRNLLLETSGTRSVDYTNSTFLNTTGILLVAV